MVSFLAYLEDSDRTVNFGFVVHLQFCQRILYNYPSRIFFIFRAIPKFHRIYLLLAAVYTKKTLFCVLERV